MKLPFNLGGKMARASLYVKNMSPELCLAGSILFGAACVVTSCMATLKSEPVVKEAKAKELDIRRIPSDGVKEANEKLMAMRELTKEKREELQAVRRKAALTVIRHFALPAALGAVSVALNIADNRILRRNLTAATVAYAGLLESYNEYRKRVIADVGREKDQEYLHGIKKQKNVEIDPDTGEVLGETEDYAAVDKGVSQYARYFDEGEWDQTNKRWIHQNLAWKDDNFINQKTLRSAEREANQKLVIDGFLFLNDVYRMLGLPLSIDGQIVGWVYDGEGGDHAVSFGVFDDDPRQLPYNRAFVDGRRNTALLDFNVDGPIINELENFFGKEMTTKLIASRM